MSLLGKPYPTSNMEDFVSKIKSENWTKNPGYSFRILDTSTGMLALDFDEFHLQINPQDLSQDENFSVNITPTQSGKVIEHQGIVFRDLTISGTTGVNPNVTSLNLTSGQSITSVGSSLLNKKTGYEEFLQLRNYFRAYAGRKQDPSCKSYIMEFVNWKDNEWFLVEPIKFSLKRSKTDKFLYNYVIVMKILGFSKSIFKPALPSFLTTAMDYYNTAMEAITIATNVVNTSKELLKKIESEIVSTIIDPIRKVTNLVKSITGLAYTITDMRDSLKADWKNMKDAWNELKNASTSTGTSIITNNAKPTLVKDLSKNVNGTIQTANYVAMENTFGFKAMSQIDLSKVDEATRKKFSEEVEKDNKELTRQSLTTIKNNVRRVKDNLIENVGLGSSEYNSYIGRTETFVPEDNRQPTYEELQVIQGLEYAEKAIDNLIAPNTLFMNPLSDKINNVLNIFNNSISMLVPKSAKEITIQSDDTLEKISARELGTAERWSEIALLNNLESPYIDLVQSTNTKVKTYGDKLLIPSNSSPVVNNIIPSPDYPITDNLTEIEKQMGIDIQLTKDNDFFINNNNDIELISGIDNVGQAVIIKLSLERGELKYHTELGLSINIGEKLKRVDQITESLTRTILQDPRFRDIKNLSVTVQGDIVMVNLDLSVENVGKSIPITLQL